MFGIFRRARALPPVARSPWRTTLRLESLEWRDQPSDIPLGNPPTSPFVYAANGKESLPNAAPVIADFDAEQLTNGLFMISGRVIDEAPGGLTVNLGGGTSANGQTITTTPDGTFTLIFQFRVDGTDCGFLTAKVTDAQGLQSATVQIFVDPTPP